MRKVPSISGYVFPASLDCSVLIDSSVLSNVYVKPYTSTNTQTVKRNLLNLGDLDNPVHFNDTKMSLFRHILPTYRKHSLSYIKLYILYFCIAVN